MSLFAFPACLAAKRRKKLAKAAVLAPRLLRTKVFVKMSSRGRTRLNFVVKTAKSTAAFVAQLLLEVKISKASAYSSRSLVTTAAVIFRELFMSSLADLLSWLETPETRKHFNIQVRESHLTTHHPETFIPTRRGTTSESNPS